MQLYLDDQLSNALHSVARARNTTISELVRQAVRDRYLGNLEQQRQAMEQFVGSRATSPHAVDAMPEVRALRRGTRLDRPTQL